MIFLSRLLVERSYSMSCKKGCGEAPYKNPFPLYSPDSNALSRADLTYEHLDVVQQYNGEAR